MEDTLSPAEGSGGASRKAGTDDIFSARAIAQVVRNHDKQMDEARTYMGMAKAAYGSRFWEWVDGAGAGATSKKFKLFDNRYERNLIKKGVNVYHAALFPKRMAATIDRTAATTGDAAKAQTLLNGWMFTDLMRSRFDTLIRQALLYPGAGIKVSYEPRAGQAHKSLSPHERVFARVFPWWEAVLDRNVKDIEDARYYGHIYYLSKSEVIDRWGDAIEKLGSFEDLSGCREQNFLESEEGSTAARRSRTAADGDAPDPDANFVRVLELCNMVDYLEGNDYPGRFEVHLIDQGELSTEPIFVGEMPLWRPDGRPLAHILPLIFEHEAEYPFQGIAPCRAWLQQQAEVNIYKSQTASETQRSKTLFPYNKDLGAEFAGKLTGSKTMEALAIDADKVGGDVRKAITAIEVSANTGPVREARIAAEQELLADFAVSPSAIGITQNVTAQEIRYQRDYTDSEMGRYAAARDRVFARFGYLGLRAHTAAMLDDGDMESDEAAEADADLEAVDLADDAVAEEFDEETGARLRPVDDDARDPRLDDDDSPAEALRRKLSEEDARAREPREPSSSPTPGQPEPQKEVSLLLLEALAEGRPVEADDDAAELYADRGIQTSGEETIKFLDAKGETLIITVENIDSEFDIGFTETGRTPASDAEIRANLAQILPQYMELLQVMLSGGVEGLIAEAAARAYFSEYALPENLNPDRIKAQFEEQQKKAEEEGGTVAPPGSPADAQAPPADAQAPPADAGVLVQQLVEAHQQDPAAVPPLKVVVDALQQAQAAAQTGDPQAVEMLGQLTGMLSRIAALPPESQVEGLVGLAQNLTGSPPPNAAGGPAPVSGV